MGQMATHGMSVRRGRLISALDVKTRREGASMKVKA
jgi:hypothetical protein